MAKRVCFADGNRGDRGMNGIEKRRSARGLAAVMRNFQEVRGESSSPSANMLRSTGRSMSPVSSSDPAVLEAQDEGIIVAGARRRSVVVRPENA